MRSEIAQPCLGPGSSVRRMSRSRVPCNRSRRDSGGIVLSNAYIIGFLLSDVNNKMICRRGSLAVRVSLFLGHPFEHRSADFRTAGPVTAPLPRMGLVR